MVCQTHNRAAEGNLRRDHWWAGDCGSSSSGVYGYLDLPGLRCVDELT